MFKSRFRGVYKCGKRWKAQLQSQGVQFYLGTFDSEEEAAKAYDRKARDEKGEKGQTNFDDNGEETINPISHGDGSEEFAVPVVTETSRPTKKVRTSLAPATNGVPSNQAVSPVVPDMLFSHENSSTQVRVMWERLCQITQRMLLAKAAHEKLSELQALSPDNQKAHLLSSLDEEIALLGVATKQVESAIIVFVSKGLTPAQTSSAIASCVNSTDTDTDACHSTTANTNYSDNANADTSGSATATYDAYIGTGMSDHDQSGEYDRPISSSVVTREKESDSGEDNGNHESHPSRGMLIPSTANRDREGNGDRDGDIYASRDIKSNIDGSGGSGSDGKFNDRSHDYGTGNNVYDSDSSNSNNNSNSNISRGVGMGGERHQTAAATITVTGTGTGITSLPRPRSSSEDEDGDGDAEEDSIDHDQAVQKGTDRGETHAEKEAQEEDGRAIYHGYTTNHNNMNIEEGTREMEEESGGMGEHKEGRYDNDENESN